jgi:C1A family cysteine protease
MLQRILAVAALSAAISTSLAPSSAEAGERWRLKFFLPQFYSYEEDDIYAYEPDFEDERYYEPEYMNPDDEPDYVAPKKKTKKKTATTVAQPPVKKKLVSVEKKPAATTAAVAATTPATAAATTKISPAGMSCDKAGQIITGYGFTSVKPQICTGKVYAFNATRSGKNYLVKLSAANGELTEVKKLR